MDDIDEFNPFVPKLEKSVSGSSPSRDRLLLTVMMLFLAIPCDSSVISEVKEAHRGYGAATETLSNTALLAPHRWLTEESERSGEEGWRRKNSPSHNRPRADNEMLSTGRCWWSAPLSDLIALPSDAM
ncbi:hypothetical protein EYF80_011765 [Liparis tanakae]|uniref:Uncharacterized protein n=1 Tax=Liparis tanakae TaxID=230148 RepID=A0A4Z2IJS4_9TELE|nr:hypothetical protein EYF80_011765 [Liparis tanakae]